MRVNVTARQELVGPDDLALELLWKGESLEQIQIAVQRSGKGVDDVVWLGGTLLFHAVAEDRADVARWLLEEGAAPDGLYRHVGGVPLEEAIRLENVAMVKLLIAGGADLDLEMTSGMTPRRRAEEIGNPAIVEALSVAPTTKSEQCPQR